MRLLGAFLMFCTMTVANAAAQPVVSGVSGSWVDGGTMTVTGAGFGSKVPARPLLWADFATDSNPSPLGIKTSWDSAPTELARVPSCPGQTGACLGSVTAGYGVWTAGVNFSNYNDLGQKWYLHRLVRKNFVATGNWKIWRIWGTAFGDSTSYIAENNSNWPVEYPGGVISYYLEGIKAPANTWLQDELIVKVNTDVDVQNGENTYRMNGVPINRISGNTSIPGPLPHAYKYSTQKVPMTLMFPVHFVAANKEIWSPAWSSTNHVWADDIYLDTTWARVMVGNAATYNACTHLAPQIPTAWSNTSITVVGNLGALRRISTPYLYVVDAQGRVNSAGLRLNAPDGSIAPGAPSDLRIIR